MNKPAMLSRNAVVALPVLFLLASCQKEEVEPLDLNVSAGLELRYDHLDFIVPSAANSGALDIPLDFDAQQDLQDLLAQNGFAMDDLREVRLLEARALIVEPENTHFDAVEGVHLDLASSTGNTITLARKEVVPDGLGILDLQVDNSDLSEMLRAGSGTLHAALETSSPIAGGTKLRFAITLSVKAQH